MKNSTPGELTAIGIAFILVGLFSAVFYFADKEDKAKQAAKPTNYITAHSPITIDACQYLMVKISDSNKEFLSLIHKGNCTNHVYERSKPEQD